jgi:hypothetical protein
MRGEGVVARWAEYQRGSRSPVQLQKDISDFWAELPRNVTLQQSVDKAGIGPDMLEALRRPGTYTFEEKGAGLDPEVVALIVGLGAQPVAHAANTLWDQVILPWIRRRWGDDAVGPKK